MICRTLSAIELSRDLPLMQRIARNLTRPASDFHAKIDRWAAGLEATPEDGHLAIVEDDGELVGWARTEPWERTWATLESFVHLGWRRRGVATFAAAGLVASFLLPPDAEIAVFRPAMLMLARRVGLHPVLFAQEGDRWVRQ
jgi:hypothetical protein